MFCPSCNVHMLMDDQTIMKTRIRRKWRCPKCEARYGTMQLKRIRRGLTPPKEFREMQ